MLASADDLVKSVAPFVLPPMRVKTQYAAENYMMLKGGGGMVPWSARKTPYMIEPMNCLTSRLYSSVGFKGPARTGKTEALLKAQVAHAVKCDPSDILIVHMNQNESEYFSKTEIAPMLNANKELRAAKSGVNSDNNVGFIRLKAGNVIKLSWPTNATFRGKSFKYVLLPDYDAIKAPGEGDVFMLSRMRTKSYQSAGMVLAESSPGFDCVDYGWQPQCEHECPPAQGIADIYMLGDRRRFYWQCPECGEGFIPDFKNLLFDRDARDPVKAAQEVYMMCPHCASTIEEKLKNRLNFGGKWLKQGQTIDQNWQVHGQGIISRSATFWLPGPVAAFSKWGEDFVEKFIRAKNSMEKTGDEKPMQAFVNTDCGQVYIRERKTELDSNSLKSNQSPRKSGVVPNWAKFLLASADVQGGSNRRFVVQVHAIGDGKRQAVIERFEIKEFEGEAIKPHTNAKHWDSLITRVLERWWPVEGGEHEMKPLVLAYDTNGEAGVYDRAQEFYKNNAGYGIRLMPIKGASGSQGELVVKSDTKESKDKTKSKSPKRRKKKGNPLYLLNTNAIKDVVSANMLIEHGQPKSIEYNADLDESFFNELMAEERNDLGKWEKVGHANNEAFDLCVYIWAILVQFKWVEMDIYNEKNFSRGIRPVK